ncbi:hypothetical protein BpHYR1_011351 [Brachionus plicatilis]|uniref:Uncharacterized protein n=1 Tax=Brachionus plicatilis TaxID=10195 RepID=A0A3M7SLV5_BRAPC|nr:hypothetical protein BpHYR1_011351 [Brachionus plicatilis]
MLVKSLHQIEVKARASLDIGYDNICKMSSLHRHRFQLENDLLIPMLLKIYSTSFYHHQN